MTVYKGLLLTVKTKVMMSEMSYLLNQLELLGPKTLITAEILADLIRKAWEQAGKEEEELLNSMDHP